MLNLSALTAQRWRVFLALLLLLAAFLLLAALSAVPAHLFVYTSGPGVTIVPQSWGGPGI